MSRVIIRATVPSDLPHVIAEPLPYRIKTLTAVLQNDDGETVLGVGGIAYPAVGSPWAFVQIAPDVSPKDYPVACHRAGLMAMKMIRASRLREVAATCDAGNEAAVRWLKRLGFVPAEKQTLPANRLLWFWTRPTSHA